MILRIVIVLILALALVYALILADSGGYSRAEGAYLDCLVKLKPKTSPIEVANCALAMPYKDKLIAKAHYERILKK